jgi:hypothetical protein
MIVMTENQLLAKSAVIHAILHYFWSCDKILVELEEEYIKLRLISNNIPKGDL